MQDVDITEEYLALADVLAYSTQAVVIVVYQIPNCPIVFKSDESRVPRSEDAMLAWAWRQYYERRDPHWLPRLPMMKAAMQCMKAAADFLKLKRLEDWVVSGASKRGWTTFLLGGMKCQTCPKIKAIIPMVPIVPMLIKEVHWQYQSYGGWTFAFRDYKDAGILHLFDKPHMTEGIRLVDPINYFDQLEHIPKLVVLASDDEFMQFDWTSLWYVYIRSYLHFIA